MMLMMMILMMMMHDDDGDGDGGDDATCVRAGCRIGDGQQLAVDRTPEKLLDVGKMTTIISRSLS